MESHGFLRCQSRQIRALFLAPTDDPSDDLMGVAERDAAVDEKVGELGCEAEVAV